MSSLNGYTRHKLPKYTVSNALGTHMAMSLFGVPGEAQARLYTFSIAEKGISFDVAVPPEKSLTEEESDRIVQFAHQQISSLQRGFAKYGYSARLKTGPNDHQGFKIVYDLLSKVDQPAPYYNSKERALIINYVGENSIVRNDLVLGHELAHHVLSSFIQKPPMGFPGALIEAVCDYISWISRGHKSEDLKAFEDLRPPVSFRKSLKEQEQNEHEASGIFSRLLMQFTLRLRSEESISQFQETLRSVLKSFNDDVWVHNRQVTFHHLYNRLMSELDGFAQREFQLVMDELKIPRSPKLVRMSTPEGQQSRDPIYPDYVEIGKWEFVKSISADEKKYFSKNDYSANWTTDEHSYHHLHKLHDQITITSEGDVFRLKVKIQRVDQSTQRFEIQKVDLQTYETTPAFEGLLKDHGATIELDIQQRTNMDLTQVSNYLVEMGRASGAALVRLNGFAMKRDFGYDANEIWYARMAKVEALKGTALDTETVQFLKMVASSDSDWRIQNLAKEILGQSR